MRVEETPLAGCYLIKLDHHHDDRGQFIELFQDTRDFYEFKVRQINCSHSHQYTVRGLHLAPYAKLVTCVSGKVFDVVVDMRKDSPTYLKWHSVILARDNGHQLFVPPNFAHGFMALEIYSTVVYCQDAIYQPGVEKTLHWLDPKIAIKWPEAPWVIMSEKDKKAEFLSTLLQGA